MKENYSQLRKTEDEAYPSPHSEEKTKSSALPIIGLAAGLALLILISNKETPTPDGEEEDPGSLSAIEKNFKAAVAPINSSGNLPFFRKVRSSLNASSVHTLDLLLSISVYPLMTSTLITTVKMIEQGVFKTLDDARFYMYMNLFLKTKKDSSRIPAISTPMIGHKATFLTNTNAGFNTGDFKWWAKDFMRFIPGTVYNGSNYLVRSTIPFPLTEENPLFNVNPPEGYRLVQFPYNFQPCDKWDKNDQKLTDHMIPNFFDKQGVSLCSSSALGDIITEMVKSNVDEYTNGYKMNIANAPLWLDDPSFYLNPLLYSPVLNTNSAAFIVTQNDSTVKTEESFIDALTNSNTITHLPSTTFMNVSLRFASLEGSLITYFDTGGIEFGHYMDIPSVPNHWAPDRMSHINTIYNIGQLAFSIVDNLLLNVLKHSSEAQNNHFPISFMNTVVFTPLDQTKWKEPLFPVETRRYTYFDDPLDNGPII